MKIAVGSKNPVKIEATKQAFEAVWPDISWEIIGISVASGIADQPMSDEESIRGATNRAQAALSSTGADYGVGLEGGLQRHGNDYYDCGWVVVVNKKGIIGIGATAKVLMPSKIMELINGGMELGDACDEVFQWKNIKQAEGYFGYITKNVITRTSGYRDGVVMALARFIHPRLFEE